MTTASTSLLMAAALAAAGAATPAMAQAVSPGPVVAPGNGLEHVAVAQGMGGVEEGRRVRPGDATRGHDPRGRPILQDGEGAGDVEKVDGGVGPRPHRPLREAAHGQHAIGAARPVEGIRDELRQPSGPRDEGDGVRARRRRHGLRQAAAGVPRGVQIERLPPSRMKARIS